MAVTAQYASACTVREVLEVNTASSPESGRTVTHSNFNTSLVLHASSTPPATKVAAFEQALTAGAATIDLTALTGANGVAVDGTGLKVQVLKIRNPDDNDPVTVAVGASNGYELAGADFSVAIPGGGEFTFYGNDGAPDIGLGAKTLDLSGTGAEKVEVIVVMG
ncbi:MAG TPA: hypothetical protein PKG51_11380 [Arachnia sp.]|nr:hypothetical protein [Arachnia sp.]